MDVGDPLEIHLSPHVFLPKLVVLGQTAGMREDPPEKNGPLCPAFQGH